MEFNKYKERGAYHWAEYKAGTEYGKHADIVKEWLKEETNILDVGAGDGLITHLIGAYGVDDNETAVKLAREKDVDVILGSVYKLPFRNCVFNSVYFGDVIEHLEHPQKAVTEISRVMVDGGRLYIVTPPALPSGKLQDKYHYTEYTPESLKTLVESLGFELAEEVKTIKHRMYAKFVKQALEA
jgi:ubiquinone/menaquinone biosynthesis C-methylase UbiE